METIKALIEIKQKLKSRNKESKAKEVYSMIEHFLLTNDQATDEDLCTFLYGNTKKTTTYRSVKFRFEDQLVDDVFLHLSSLNQDNNYGYKAITASKIYTITLALQKFGFVNEAIHMYSKNLAYCRKYSLTAMAILNVKPLYYHYAFVNTNASKMFKYLEESESLMKLYEAEKYVEQCNAHISFMYVNGKGAMTTSQKSQISEMISNILKICSTYSSRSIDILSYDLICYYYLLIGDFHSCIKIGLEGLEKAQTKMQHDNLFEYKCSINLAISNFHLDHYKESERWFLKAIQLTGKESRNWLHDSAKYFVVLVRMKAYDKMIPLYSEVIQCKALKKLKFIHEKWLIIEAVIHLLIDLGKIQISKVELSKLPKFSVNKFINSVPFYTKDKKGQFITVQVLKILFLLQKGEHDKIINLSDSLNQYTYKYLKNDETLRSNCFIKMILKMIKANFHPVRTELYVKPLLSRLSSEKVIIDEGSAEVEIIPYEELWIYISEMIQMRRRKG